MDTIQILDDLHILDLTSLPTKSYKDWLSPGLKEIAETDQDVVTTGNLACSIQYFYPKHRNKFICPTHLLTESKRKKMEYFGVQFEEFTDYWITDRSLLIQMGHKLNFFGSDLFKRVLDFDTVIVSGYHGTIREQLQFHPNIVYVPFEGQNRQQEMFDLTGFWFEEISSVTWDGIKAATGKTLLWTGGLEWKNLQN